MDYRIDVRPAALRDLAALRGHLRRRCGESIDQLAQVPRPPGVKKLRGADGLWRVRVGDWRVVYSINDALRVVTVVRLAHRRDVYR